MIHSHAAFPRASISRFWSAFLMLALIGCGGRAPVDESEPEGADLNHMQPADSETLQRIAFGSCADQNRPQPIWDRIIDANPQLFLFIGDNIYGDTEDMDVLREKYGLLAHQEGYRRLVERVPVVATWDDHDYGANDSGREYPMKEESEKIFEDFFDVPADARRRQRAGVYDAHVVGPGDRRVQIILLDTRFFRSPLKTVDLTEEEDELGYGPYGANTDADATMLGEEQWAWLGRQLEQPAELRLIISSIQVIPAEHGWERWSEFPRERERLFDLVTDKAASGVLFLSGDTHWGELSRYDDGPYPLYELTSSALNQEWVQAYNLPNAHRIDSVYAYPNFGIVDIDWGQPDPTIELRLHDADGGTVLSHEIRLSELQAAG